MGCLPPLCTLSTSSLSIMLAWSEFNLLVVLVVLILKSVYIVFHKELCLRARWQIYEVKLSGNASLPV